MSGAPAAVITPTHPKPAPLTKAIQSHGNKTVEDPTRLFFCIWSVPRCVQVSSVYSGRTDADTVVDLCPWSVVSSQVTTPARIRKVTNSSIIDPRWTIHVSDKTTNEIKKNTGVSTPFSWFSSHAVRAGEFHMRARARKHTHITGIRLCDDVIFLRCGSQHHLLMEFPWVTDS